MRLNKEEIKQVIPHRDPFLLVDEMVDLVPAVSGTGILRLTGEEYFFAGHFPGNPIMPGVLLIEALAQAGAVVILSHKDFQGKIGLFGGIKKAKFRRRVLPGDEVYLYINVTRVSKMGGKADIVAKVEGEVAVEAEIMTVIVDK